MLKIQKIISKYTKARSWDKLPPADLAKSISIEAAELLEHFQWSNPTPQDIKKNKEKFEAIRDEVADVLIYCHEFANRLGFDLDTAIKAKLKKVEKKYPAKLFKNSKDPHGTGIYEKIKKEYRMKK